VIISLDGEVFRLHPSADGNIRQPASMASRSRNDSPFPYFLFRRSTGRLLRWARRWSMGLFRPLPTFD